MAELEKRTGLKSTGCTTCQYSKNYAPNLDMHVCRHCCRLSNYVRKIDAPSSEIIDKRRSDIREAARRAQAIEADLNRESQPLCTRVDGNPFNGIVVEHPNRILQLHCDAYEMGKCMEGETCGEIVDRTDMDLHYDRDIVEEVQAEIDSQFGNSEPDDGVYRKFDTGATRDTAEGKLDYEGFLSPAVLKQYAKYMNMNRLQSDGNLRDSDNWQKGIPKDVYMKSGYRHFFEWWEFHRQINLRDRDGVKEGIGAMCGLLFNVMGYLHEWLKLNPEVDFDGDEPTFEMKEKQDAIKKISETEGS